MAMPKIPHLGLVAILPLLPGSVGHATEANPSSPEQIAMQFVNAAFLKRDLQETESIVKPGTKRFIYGDASIVDRLRMSFNFDFPSRDEVRLAEMHFAERGASQSLTLRFARFVFDGEVPERIATRIREGNAPASTSRDATHVALAIFEAKRMGKMEPLSVLFSLEQLNGEYRVSSMRIQW